jgi:FkbM family methyltransferase
MKNVITRYGNMTIVDGDSVISRALTMYGEWAMDELNLLSKLIAPGMCVLDVGAYIGTHTLAFAKLVGLNGKVYSFEPRKEIHAILANNVATNTGLNVFTLNAGMAEKEQTIFLDSIDMTDKRNFGGLALDINENSPKSSAYEVKLLTIDSLEIGKIDLIKLDVEGMERRVLDGAVNTVLRDRPIISCECNSLDAGNKLLDFCSAVSYDVRGFLASAYNKDNFNSVTEDIFEGAKELTLLLIPKERTANIKKDLFECNLIAVTNIEDLVLPLIHKPQYAYEVLLHTASCKALGMEFPSPLVTQRDSEIARLRQEMFVRNDQYETIIRANLCHIQKLENAVWAEQERCLSEVAKVRRELDVIIRSRSWKVTAPLRKVMKSRNKLSEKAFDKLLKVYRTLPITSAQRTRLKSILFTVFGFAFARMDAYKRWKEYRQIKAEWAIPASAENVGAFAASVTSKRGPALPTADGIWEWADYDAVKSRIIQFKSAQLAKVAPIAPDMIDIGRESFASVAGRIRLPAFIDMPDVSIILPVFNNLKLTLECLLSIVAHTDQRTSFEIILLDDASTDETPQVLRQIANLRVIRNDKNLGFIRSCNKALEQVRGRYVLYLNNDVQVTPGWLTSLYETFAMRADAGAVGAKCIYPSGHLQEAGVAFRYDGTADMVGLNEDATRPRYNYIRRVDYISGVCLMLPTDLLKNLSGFSEEFLPCYCEDSDLCLRVQAAGYNVYYNPAATIIHYLSSTTTTVYKTDWKLTSIASNTVKLQQKWSERLDQVSSPKIIAFYLPQFHPIPENDRWWGAGFTEWTNVTKALPNFVGHYQPRLPADLGFYDLRLPEVMQQQAALARRYGIHGFCYYYYWFGGRRLLEQPIEKMLETGKPDMPFCLCWANENWTRRWDGQDQDVLIEQHYSAEDDIAVINDLLRFFRDPRYIRIDGCPLILVYRVTLFPDFAVTVARWREVCKQHGLGDIYVAMVESMELVHANKNPQEYGCNAAVEFPPLEMANRKTPSGAILNSEFHGGVADYRDIAIQFATREFPGYTRFKGVMPGWDNTARRQNNGFCFEHATPGTFQAWLEESIEQTRQQHYGDERLVFINAWNEWAEGAYLEPDKRFGHSYLEAVRNAVEAPRLLRKDKYWYET